MAKDPLYKPGVPDYEGKVRTKEELAKLAEKHPECYRIDKFGNLWEDEIDNYDENQAREAQKHLHKREDDGGKAPWVNLGLMMSRAPSDTGN